MLSSSCRKKLSPEGLTVTTAFGTSASRSVPSSLRQDVSVNAIVVNAMAPVVNNFVVFIISYVFSFFRYLNARFGGILHRGSK